MAEYSRLATGSVVSTGGATPVVIPFKPTGIKIFNATRAAAASGVTSAWWLESMGEGAAAVVTTSAGPADGTSFISAATGGGFSTVQGALALQYGSSINISTVTKASPAVVTTSSNHGYVSGDVVILTGLYQTATTGMPQICGIPFVVTVTGATTFTIPWNTNQSNFTAYNSGTSTVQATVKKVLYPALYAPGVAFISAISTGATTTISCSSPHNFVVGQEVGFHIPSQYGTTQLNTLPNSVIPGQPVYGFVSAVSSATQFVVSINSTGYTAFNSNQSAGSSLSGLTPAVVYAVGDANTGFGLNSIAPLYPSPSIYIGGSTSASSTIGSPAIAGSFVNATYQGFIIGASVAGSASDVIYWEAVLHDIAY